MSTIPMSQIVSVQPNVLPAGGNALEVIGLMLTSGTRVPIGVAQPFATAAAVATYFGASSTEAAFAASYFAGPTNATAVPGSVLFAQYNGAVAVAAFLRGGNAAANGLAAIQAISSGSLTVLMDGYTHTASGINLTGATSFSNAAALIDAALNASEPTEASFTASLGAAFTATGSGTNLTATSVTGIISVGDVIAGTGVPGGATIVSQTSGSAGGAGVYVTSVATTAVAASIVASSTVLDVTVCASPTIAVGQTVVGSGVTGSPVITSQISGTAGGVGLYRISGTAQHIVSESMTGAATAPTVTYDSTSGGFVITSGITGVPSTAAFATGSLATTLLLTSVLGAVLSQGAAATTPAAFMNAMVNITTDWVTFLNVTDPDNGSGTTQRLAFAAWTSGQNNRFAYLAHDTDASPTTSVPAAASLGQQLIAAGYSGTSVWWEPATFSPGLLCAFIAGAAAAINFAQTNGRITFAFKGQSGLATGVNDPTTAANLIANGYNYYGGYATAAQPFQWAYPGTVAGAYLWLDSYINQIQLNNSFQLALAELLDSAKSIPYNNAGYMMIEQACQSVIDAGLNFGSIRTGTILSGTQIAEVNAAAGANIAPTLAQRGWYLQVQPAQASVRAARQSPPCTFWYCDGQSIQKITLASIEVQ